MEAVMRRILFIYNRHAGKNKTWFGLSDMINAMTEQNCLEIGRASCRERV